MLSGFFADKPTYRKFLIVVSVVLFCTVIFSMVGALIVDAVYGVNMISDPSALSDLRNPNTLAAMKLLQLISTGIGMFLLPSLLLAWLFSDPPMAYLQIRKSAPASTFFLTLVIMFAAIPLINVMVLLNQQMELPSFLSGLEDWIQASEDNAMRITEALLNMNSTGELFYNLLIIAVLPALGEEFLFRGILQKLFKEMTQNVHVAIVITSVIFSAIHMQFYGFLPRMMLGILFGYLLHWSGSIWVPVFAHFINNGAAVVFAYFAGKEALPFNQDTVGATQEEWLLAVIATLILTGLLYRLYRTRIVAAETINEIPSQP
ncbi:MAG: CPBP family intramembrane metalloprotease [Bacteroidota bacterium]|nr:CPBP family intramembrane metalloprotease [Bacteroidota bacterium]